MVLPFKASTTTGKASQGAGFYGLNLHYLPLVLRARLMDSLYQYVNKNMILFEINEEIDLEIFLTLLLIISQINHFQHV